jgi:hypothetical protein
MGEFFPDFNASSGGRTNTQPKTFETQMAPSGSTFSGSVRPETLLECRGHVLVPAMEMVFVPAGAQPPSRGQYLREESLTPPYRVLPPGAAGTMDFVPSRLNVDLDRDNRIINLRCG